MNPYNMYIFEETVNDRKEKTKKILESFKQQVRTKQNWKRKGKKNER